MPTDDLDTDFFLRANLRPNTTGLPMVVWVSERGYARHDVRVKVALQHGDRIDPSHIAVSGVRPTPGWIFGNLSAADQRVVSDWIKLNEAAIVEYWDGVIDTGELLGRLKRVKFPLSRRIIAPNYCPTKSVSAGVSVQPVATPAARARHNSN